jgi:hypothetical protein
MLSQGQALTTIGTYLQALKNGDNHKNLDDLLQALMIIGTYLQALKNGDNHKNLDDLLCTDTIMGFIHAAALYLETQYNITIPLYIQKGGAHKHNTLNLFFVQPVGGSPQLEKEKSQKGTPDW